ncbi:MAG: hypothetical protein J0M12_07920 [Deltaproteobacteria bacterium]|nr:hypothetical protein [Deltaproteobacteria bacterium]
MSFESGFASSSIDEYIESSDYDNCLAESALDSLKACSQHIISTARLLESRVAPGVRLPNGIDSSKVRSVISKVRSVSNREFRNLVGLLNYVREEHSGLTLERALAGIVSSELVSSEFREICYLLKSIRDQGFEYHTGRSPLFSEKVLGLELANPAFNWDREFADRTLRLVRFLYPLGVNMLNPGLLQDVPSAISAGRIIKISLPGGRHKSRVEVMPLGESSRIVHVPPVGAEREFEPIELRDGMAVLIGRELAIADLYGHALGDGPIQMPVQGKVQGRQVSRGGLLIIRHAQQIYLFDRGSLHDVPFSYEGGVWNRYQSASRRTPSGFEHGKSGVYQPSAEQRAS